MALSSYLRHCVPIWGAWNGSDRPLEPANSLSPRLRGVMRILVTNDDGIHAPGLGVLEEIARELSDDVWVVAPETNQSGSAHSLTIHEPLRCREVDERKFAIRGTPT